MLYNEKLFVKEVRIHLITFFIIIITKLSINIFYIYIIILQAVLKFARLVANKLKIVPFKSEMPTSEELKSFSLELCVPLRPDSITMNEE